MKKNILLPLIFTLSCSVLARETKMNEKLEQQMLEGFELQQSLKQYTEQKSGGFVTVGADTSCDFRIGTTKIQNAIDAGNTEIRIASNETHNENLILNDISVTLKGGYADCTAANAGIQTGTTSIRGVHAAAIGAVIAIFGEAQRNNIVLDSLSLFNGGVGEGFIPIPGGGVSVFLADAAISINNTIISANRSSVGGGLSIVSGNADIRLFDSQIIFNNADSGGGIYCAGAESSILIEGNSGVSSNTADGISGAFTGDGGGVFLSADCDFTSYSGADGTGFSGIAGNKAYGHGGGIYVSGGSSAILYGYERCFGVLCIGDNTNPVNLNSNIANFDGVGGGNGGGAYITGGPPAGLTMYAAKITENKAKNGGALYVNDGGALLIKRNASPCWDQEHCNYIARNKTGTDTGLGGAIFNNSSLVNVINAVIENNRADFGTVIYGIGSNSRTTIKGSVIHHNGNNGADDFADRYVFRANTDAQIDIHFSTIADNNAEFAVFGMTSDAAATSGIFSSIVHDASTGVIYSETSSQVTNDCTIFHEGISVPFLGLTSIVDNPEFVDRNNNNYHINALTSPAVDYCDDFSPVDYPDMDFEDYGFDDSSVSNNLGPYDIGADETYANDIIFINGFD